VESTWETRDLPVLEYIVEYYDEHGDAPDPSLICEALDMDDEDVQRALRALQHDQPPFITDVRTTAAGTIFGVGAPTGHARRTVGAWPTPDALAERIVAALNEAAEQEPDPETKGRLKRAAQAVGGVGREVMIRVLSDVMTKGM
jgi:hypothetical protein